MPPPPPTSSWPPASSATPPPPPPDDEELPPYSPCRGGPSCRDHNSTEPAVRRPGAPRQPSYSAWAPSVVHSRAGLSRLRAMERVESDEERRERVRREQEAELAHWREQVALATILREAEEDSRPQRRAHATSRGLGPTSSAAPAPTPSPPSSSSALGLHGVSHTPVAPSSPPLPTSRTRPRAGTSPAPHSRSPSTTTSPTSTQPQPHLSHTSSSSSLSSYRSNTSSAPHTPPDNTSALPLPLPAWCNSPAPTPRLTRSASAPNFELLTLEDLEAAYTPVRVPLLRRKVTPNHLRNSHPVPSRMDSRTATTSRTTSRTSAESRRERNPWSPSGIAERLSPRALVERVERSPSPPPAAQVAGDGQPSPSRNRPFSFFRRPTRQYPPRAEPLPHGHEHSSVYGRPAQHPQSEHTYAPVPPRLFEQWPTRLPIEYKLWCTPFLGYDDVPVEEEVVGVISEM